MSYLYAGLWGPETFEDSYRSLLGLHTFDVYLPSTSTHATLYTDRTKGTTAANPATTDSEGNGSFFADPGVYEVEVNGLRIPATVQPDPVDLVNAAGGRILDDVESATPVTTIGTTEADIASMTNTFTVGTKPVVTFCSLPEVGHGLATGIVTLRLVNSASTVQYDKRSFRHHNGASATVGNWYFPSTLLWHKFAAGTGAIVVKLVASHTAASGNGFINPFSNSKMRIWTVEG